ncbi:MAG: hypothetical protein ACI9GK_002369, partial [Devosia sp.]
KRCVVLGKVYESLVGRGTNAGAGVAWLRERPFLVIMVLAALCWLFVAAVLVGVFPSGL